MKKLLFLLITILGLFLTPSAYIKDKGAWDGSETNVDNWSKWSITDDYPEASVRMTVWIPVDKWKSGVEDKTKYDNPIKECTAENGNSCSVWSPDGVKIKWNRGESHENPKVCGDYRQGDYNSKNEGCKCTEDFQRPTAYCGKTGTPAYKSCGKEKVTAKELLAKPNETVVLYAIWKKHDYEVNYNQICGTTNKTTFNYDKGTSLPSPDLSKCEEPNIKFEGWYTENEHIHKVDSIPSGTKEDLDLYAKLSQKRYYNYSTNKWTFVKQQRHPNSEWFFILS